jgi:hypothetical protein
MSTLYKTNIELAYWKDSPLVDMSLHLDLFYPDSEETSLCFYS